MEAKKVGLQIYTSQENSWPAVKFTIEDLVNGFRYKTYEHTFENNFHNDEKILHMSQSGKRFIWKVAGIWVAMTEHRIPS